MVITCLPSGNAQFLRYADKQCSQTCADHYLIKQQRRSLYEVLPQYLLRHTVSNLQGNQPAFMDKLVDGYAVLVFIATVFENSS